MGSAHFTNLVFVWHSPVAVQALAQILLPHRPCASVVNWRAMGVNRQPDRDLLCIETKNIVAGADILDAVNAVDVSALAAAFARQSEREMPAMRADNDLPSNEASYYAWEVSSADRCLAWLAEKVGDPVSRWEHSGDHGLRVEQFSGYGPTPAAWRNRLEWQGPDWDNSRPRSALTAALWYVGFQSQNFDECQAFGARGLPALLGGLTDVLDIKRSTDPARTAVRLPEFLTRDHDSNEVTG